jgi:hypothetical protein
MANSTFDVWTSWWRNGAEMARTGMRFAEMVQAAGTVIDSRSRTMLAASQDPVNADHGELARMVPEKMQAFSQAGAVAFGDMCALQVDAFATWQQMWGIALSGRPASVAQIENLMQRSSKMADRMVGASGRALEPVHRRATANARRLRRAG